MTAHAMCKARGRDYASAPKRLQAFFATGCRPQERRFTKDIVTRMCYRLPVAGGAGPHPVFAPLSEPAFRPDTAHPGPRYTKSTAEFFYHAVTGSPA